ncbi:hypothetical protein QN089_02110 [Kurthia sp. YJT4]|uniref:hypothetical protein n=1 Tax=Kurthia sp. YJT4 TaxID=3049086 RepID=UPI00254DCBCE|nr:hypothetical protein [Kurthia sp. YJT4]WIL39075.1 hypothetical protein QN089_02110 [Kurthia sp. YJT4]
MKKLCMMMMLIFTISLAGLAMNAQAAENPTLTSGKAVEGTLTNQKEITYQIKVTKPSYIQLQGTAYSPMLYMDLVDQKNNVIKQLHNEFSDSMEQTPANGKVSEYLEAGTYTIKIHRGENESTEAADYRLLVTVKASAVTEIEPNNGSKTAMTLPVNAKAIKGQMSFGDATDFYKVELKEAGNLSIKVKGYLRDMVVNLYDQDLQRIFRLPQYYYGNILTGVTQSNNMFLEKGIYYVRINNTRATGLYEISAPFEPTKNNDIEPNNGTSQAQLIRPNIDKITGLLSWNDKQDFYKVNVTKKGNMEIAVTLSKEAYILVQDHEGKPVYENYIAIPNGAYDYTFKKKIPVGKGHYYVKIFIYDNSYGLYNLAVNVPEMLPNAPTAKATKTKVTGTTYANSKVTAKIGSKKYTGKSNSKGAFSIKIPTQKVKTKVYVSVTTGAGTSKTTKLQVK